MRGLDRVREAVRMTRGDLTGEEVAAAIQRANDATRREGPDGTLLVTAVLCATCGSRVDLDVLGMLAAAVPSSLVVAGREPAVFQPNVVSQEVIDALQRMWAAQERTYGLCGHMVTIDAAQEFADATTASDSGGSRAAPA